MLIVVPAPPMIITMGFKAASQRVECGCLMRSISGEYHGSCRSGGGRPGLDQRQNTGAIYISHAKLDKHPAVDLTGWGCFSTRQSSNIVRRRGWILQRVRATPPGDVLVAIHLLRSRPPRETRANYCCSAPTLSATSSSKMMVRERNSVSGASQELRRRGRRSTFVPQ